MEQRQNDLRASQGAKMNLSRTRAMEKFDKHPQLALSSEIIPTEEQIVPKGGSIDARMKRVIGSGKKGKGVLQITHGGSDGVMVGSAKAHGMALRTHLEKLHGKGYADEFFGGMIATGEDKETKRFVKKLKGGYGGTTVPPPGIEVENAIADSQLAPNVRPASAYGNPPQTNPAFMKNTVGMGIGMGSHMEGGMKKQRRAPSARNMKISQLMKGSGMSLAQASKYLKDHPEE